MIVASVLLSYFGVEVTFLDSDFLGRCYFLNRSDFGNGSDFLDRSDCLSKNERWGRLHFPNSNQGV